MEAQENQVALPLRSHTILGVCEAIGEDFGFNPVFLRIPFAASRALEPDDRRSAPISRLARSCSPRACCSRSAKRPPRTMPVARAAVAANEQRRAGERRLRPRSRRGLRRALRADRTRRGAGAAAARRRRPGRARWPASSAPRSMTATTEASSGSDGAGASMPTRAAARSSRRRIGHQSPTRAVAAPSAQPLRSDIASVSSAWRAATRLASVSAAPGVLGSGPTAEVSRTR